MDNKLTFQMNIPKEQPLPTANFPKVKFEPPKYEDTLFKQMANDVKSPLEQQLAAVQSIADSAQKQAEASQLQAKLALEAAVKAEAEAKTARRDSIFAKVVSVLSLIIAISAVIVPVFTQ